MNVLSRSALAVVSALSVSLPVLGVVAAPPAAGAVGDDVIAWVEVESGAISGGPALNSGDHGNFSFTGSYTFRETGMMSTMSVTAPAAGVYPVYVRYAAGPLSGPENVTRSMGLLTNGGSRQQVSYPMTSFEDWETWRFARADVTLNQGANTIAIHCDRSVDFCRLNFDAIQVGGTAADPCLAAPTSPGYTSLFDGTFDSFDGWRKAGAGGFGRQPGVGPLGEQTGCFIRGLRGRGATWHTQQQTGPYTLKVDWRRAASDRHSSVYLASTSRSGASPVGGFAIPIGTNTGAIVPTGGVAQPADSAAVASALKQIGQWNTYTIELTDSRIRVLLNGTLVNTLGRPAGSPTTGFVGIENGSSGAVDFKDVQVLRDVELGTLAEPFHRAVLADGTTGNPGGESTLGNLVAEAQRWATSSPELGEAQIAFVHPDDLGDDLVGLAGGYPAVVTSQEAARVLPSADTLVNLRLSGAQLATVLEQQWQRTGEGEVPARPFVRLGTSAGFAYTYDPTAAEGSRVTGMWLDGVAIDPVAAYSVTASSSLAAGGGNFRAFADGTNARDTEVTGLTAMTGYLDVFAGTGAGSSPLVPDYTQHSVGVAFPGGATTSYDAGATLAVDLTSWAFSAASDLKDTSVQVSLGGRSLGAFEVDNAVGDDELDEYGQAAVRAIIPADMPGGPATATITGDQTGTSVAFPVTVVANSTTSVGVAPGSVAVKRGAATVSVAVTTPGRTSTGQVELSVNGTPFATVPLTNGTATASVGPSTPSAPRRSRPATSATPRPSRAAARPRSPSRRWRRR